MEQLFANVLKLHVVKLDYIALAKAMGNSNNPPPPPRSSCTCASPRFVPRS